MSPVIKTDDLGKYVKIRTGKLDANANDPDGDYPFFTCAIEPLRIATFSYDCECVLIAGNGDLNAKYYCGKFDAYQRTYIVESIDKNILDVRYLYYFLSTYMHKLREMSIGGVIKYIKLNYLTDVVIPLPPLPEQKRIAAILDKADSIRRKRQESVWLTEELLRSVFLDMFGDPVSNPKGIKNVCLSEVTTRITDGTHLTPKFIDSGVPFIFVKNIKNGKIDFQTDKYISEEEHKKLYERCPVEEGDILYTTVGATYGQAVAVGSFTKFAFQRHVAHVKPDNCKVLSDYLGTIMQLPIVKNQADRWARGAAQPTVNLTELRDFVIPLPPLVLQKEFAQKVAAVEKLKTVCRLPLEHANTLFNSLLQRAFKGKL